jgi:hypothetical protein
MSGEKNKNQITREQLAAEMKGINQKQKKSLPCSILQIVL